MHKFFVPSKNISLDTIVVSDKEQLRHIELALRLKINDELAAFDDSGNEYRCAIKELLKDKIILEIKEKHSQGREEKIKVTFACAIPKKSKMDDIIDKLTQLGVRRIIPLKTERVIIKLDKFKEASRLRRWQKIALAAAEQSQRSSVVIVDSAKSIKEALKETDTYDLKIIPTLEGERKPLKEVFAQPNPKNILVFIGPEGDFTAEEVELAKNAGCVAVSLGELVLRVETAAVAVASYIMLNAND